jgi:ferric-dicitrate binding protein FerR (iron transport regulator)
MSVTDHTRDLIQKYLEALASESELVELEGLLASDLEVANAFAEAARLHAGLESYFRKQYKIDQVAALLAAPGHSASPAEQPAGKSGAPAETTVQQASTFVPLNGGLSDARRAAFARRLSGASHRWKWIAAAALLLTIGIAIWFSSGTRADRLRLISGHVTVAGRAVTEIPENALFEVVGKEAAVIQLPGRVRIELVPATRALVRRGPSRSVVQLVSGGGDFRVQRDQSPFRVETALGVVTTTGGRFSLDLAGMLPQQFSSTAPVPMPSLAVVVVQGSVTVEHGGISTTLSAGQQQVFMNAS